MHDLPPVVPAGPASRSPATGLHQALSLIHIYCFKLPITSRSRLEGVTSTLRPNLKSPRVASIQKASTFECSLRRHWMTTDSNLRTAANFCSKLATAYSFSFTSTVLPICADRV